MILPAIKPVTHGLQVRICNAQGNYVASGFVYVDGDTSIVIDGQCYRTVVEVTWDWPVPAQVLAAAG